MRIGVTGSRGMIGRRMLNLGCEPLHSDVCDPVALDNEVNNMKPDIIIHLAGESDVKKCELGDKVKTSATNYKGSTNVFGIAEKHNAKVVFLSSDHVFSGKWFGSYREDSMDLYPKNYYGALKLFTEAASLGYDNVKVVRTSTLFYRERPMVDLRLRQISLGEEVHLPLFLWRSFMHVEDFASSLLIYCSEFDKMPKTLHISGNKTVSWYRFIRDYAKKLGMDYSLVRPRITQIADVPRPERAGLNTDLARSLHICDYDYLESM